MVQYESRGQSPVSEREGSFRHYLTQKKAALQAHMDGNGLPDYAFALDFELRKKLDAIPHFFNLCQTIVNTYASRQLQIMNQSALAVGPNQFPDVYAIAKDCARQLGIGIPNIFICGDSSVNAYTVSCDDLEPFIVVHSGLYERVSPGELRVVIGHECGHVHNQHGVYGTMANVIFNAGLNAAAIGGLSAALLNTITYGAQMALRSWSRAMEVTADRAGMICCDRIEDAYSINAKFLYGAAFGEHSIDYDALILQLEKTQNNVTQLEEMFRDHPAPVRRIMAERAFAACDIFHQWRPDLRKAGEAVRTKAVTDEICKNYINVFMK